MVEIKLTDTLFSMFLISYCDSDLLREILIPPRIYFQIISQDYLCIVDTIYTDALRIVLMRDA